MSGNELCEFGMPIQILEIHSAGSIAEGTGDPHVETRSYVYGSGKQMLMISMMSTDRPGNDRVPSIVHGDHSHIALQWFSETQRGVVDEIVAVAVAHVFSGYIANPLWFTKEIVFFKPYAKGNLRGEKANYNAAKRQLRVQPCINDFRMLESKVLLMYDVCDTCRRVSARRIVLSSVRQRRV